MHVFAYYFNFASLGARPRLLALVPEPLGYVSRVPWTADLDCELRIV